VLKIVLKSLGGQGSAPNPAGELRVLPRPPSWWGLLPPPQAEPNPLLAFGLDFRPSPNSLHFPNAFS